MEGHRTLGCPRSPGHTGLLLKWILKWEMYRQRLLIDGIHSGLHKQGLDIVRLCDKDVSSCLGCESVLFILPACQALSTT